MLIMNHCQMTRDWRLRADRQSDRHKMCVALLEDTGSYHSIIRHFCSDLLAIVRLVSLFCLSFQPSYPPPLSHSLSLSTLSQRVLCFEVTALTSQRCIIQKHRHTDTYTHMLTHTTTVYYTCMCIQLRLRGSVSLLLASHWMGWVERITFEWVDEHSSVLLLFHVWLCMCVHVCVFIGCICVSFCSM